MILLAIMLSFFMPITYSQVQFSIRRAGDYAFIEHPDTQSMVDMMGKHASYKISLDEDGFPEVLYDKQWGLPDIRIGIIDNKHRHLVRLMQRDVSGKEKELLSSDESEIKVYKTVPMQSKAELWLRIDQKPLIKLDPKTFLHRLEPWYDLPLNKVLLIATHNSVSNRPNHLFPITNQTASLRDQLHNGVRAFWFHIHDQQEKSGNRNAYVAHGMFPAEVPKALANITSSIFKAQCPSGVFCNGDVDPGRMSLFNFLRHMRLYLDLVPDAVIILYINDITSDINYIVKAINDSNVLPYIYKHNYGTSWPSLRELISSNKRLILFHRGNNQDTPYANMLHPNITYVIDVPAGQKTVSDLLKDVGAGLVISSEETAARERLAPTAPSFLILEHHVTPLTSGDIEKAKIANKVYNIKVRLNGYEAAYQIPVSAVVLDYFQEPDLAALKNFIREINTNRVQNFNRMQRQKSR